ncbi:hypothetical protein JYU34_022075 [Plutella xylostella]|uniref:Uncharacterized protein n=1 Tax=Plutella xylostella TaxID=51655 RepID=A0ABQ7PQ63_PLUXY|nr:hypothetical protein JYU34_022075 [Plutella xylostella]
MTRTRSTPDEDFIRVKGIPNQSKLVQGNNKNSKVNTNRFGYSNNNVNEDTSTMNAIKHYLHANSQQLASGREQKQMGTNGYGISTYSSHVPTATFHKHPLSYSSEDKHNILDGDLIKILRNQLNLTHNSVETGSPSNYPAKEEPNSKLEHNAMMSPYLLHKLYMASDVQKQNEYSDKYNRPLEHINAKNAEEVLISNQNHLNSLLSKASLNHMTVQKNRPVELESNISPVQNISRSIQSINNNNFHNRQHNVDAETLNAMDNNIKSLYRNIFPHDNNNNWNKKETSTSRDPLRSDDNDFSNESASNPTKIVGAIRGIVIENPKTGNRTLYQTWDNPSQEELNKMLALTNRSDLQQYYYRRLMEAKSNESTKQNMENRK